MTHGSHGGRRRCGMRTGWRVLGFAAAVVTTLSTLAGCGGAIAPRLMPTESATFAVTREQTPPALPVSDAPPGAARSTPTAETTVTGFGARTSEHIPDADKHELIRRARLDRMVVGLATGGPAVAREALTQTASTRLAEVGLHVLDMGAVKRYDAPSSSYKGAGGAEGADMLMILHGSSRLADKFGDFYSYEATCSGKLIDVLDGSPLATKRILRRGKRALNKDDAERSSLDAGGAEIVRYLTDELVRKAEKQGELMRVALTGIRSSEEADRIRASLLARPGVADVRIVSWTARSRTARLLVRMHPGVKANLAAYVETVPDIPIQVRDMRLRGVSGEKIEIEGKE